MEQQGYAIREVSDRTAYGSRQPYHTVQIGYEPARMAYRELPGPGPPRRRVVYKPLAPQYRATRVVEDDHSGDNAASSYGGVRGGGASGNDYRGDKGGSGSGGFSGGGGGGSGSGLGSHGAARASNVRATRPSAPVDPVPRIRFVHIQGDDIVVELTGCAAYTLELKTRQSSVLIGPNHPYCYSMEPFHARVQMPHAEDRCLGVRVRALLDGSGSSRARLGAWSPWHSTCEGRFKEELTCADPARRATLNPPHERTAPPCVRYLRATPPASSPHLLCLILIRSELHPCPQTLPLRT